VSPWGAGPRSFASSWRGWRRARMAQSIVAIADTR